MKKSVYMFIVSALLLTSCGNSAEAQPADSIAEIVTTVSETTETVEVTTEAVAETTETVTEVADTAETSEQTTEETQSKPDPMILYDDLGITVSFEKLAFSEEDAALFVIIDNQSDQDIMLQTRDFCINGYMSRAAFSPEVLSGKKAKEKIRIVKSEFDNIGIDKKEIKEIEFKLHICTQSFDEIATSDTITLKFNHN